MLELDAKLLSTALPVGGSFGPSLELAQVADRHRGQLAASGRDGCGRAAIRVAVAAVSGRHLAVLVEFEIDEPLTRETFAQ